MADQTPVFIKIEEYKDILAVMDLIKSKLEQSKTTLNKITEIKQQEDAALEHWKQGLEQVEKKVLFVDQKLLQPGDH